MEGNFLLALLVFWPMIGGLIGYIIGRSNKTMRDYFDIFVCVVQLGIIVALFGSASNTNPAEFVLNGFAGFGIYLRLDGFRFLYAAITSIMWLCTTMLSREYFAHYRNRNRYYLFTLITLGAVTGLFLSADLMTTFLFFEIMSFTSFVQVIHDETPGAIYAAQSYVAVAVIGGMALLMGLFITYNQLGTTNIQMLRQAASGLNDKSKLFIGALCMLFGFGSKAGMFPLHFWLPMAHPVAPAPASALLSGVLTKGGVFGILLIMSQMFSGDKTMGMVILCFGVVTMVLGAVLALFSIDLKRTLACSSVSQIGFILVGIGMMGILGPEHNEIAIAGTFLHMANHSMFKLLLFMAAGVIYMNVHKLDLNEIRGFGKRKPILMVLFLIGALGIVGVPFFSGYISKTLIHEAVVEEIWLFTKYDNMSTFFQIVEGLFTLSGGMTCAYMLKLFVSIFVEENPYHQAHLDESNKKYMSPLTLIALVIPAIVIPILGILPTKTMIPLADYEAPFMGGTKMSHIPHFFQWAALKGAVASIAIGIVLYILIVRMCMMKKDENGKNVYVNLWPGWIDLEGKIYRPGLAFLAEFGYYLCVVADLVVNIPYAVVTRLVNFGLIKYPEYDSKQQSKKRIEHYLQDHYDRLISISLTYGLVVFGLGTIAFICIMLFI